MNESSTTTSERPHDARRPVPDTTGTEDNATSASAARMLRATPAPDFLRAAHEWRRLFSEAWATFLLVVVACGPGVIGVLSGGAVTLSMKVVAPGMMVMAIIYFMGSVGGAHLNPAMTKTRPSFGSKKNVRA